MKGLFLLVTALSLLHFGVKRVEASSTSPVNATVKISVCGNSVIENGEDCEATNLNGKECTDLGFGGGALNCDIACSFDTSKCTAKTTTSTTSSSSTNPSTGSTTGTTTTTTPVSQTNATENIVPPGLNYYTDFFGPNGVIDIKKLPVALKIWVDEWKSAITEQGAGKKCDINGDGQCDLKDFSVLLYYVGR